MSAATVSVPGEKTPSTAGLHPVESGDNTPGKETTNGQEVMTSKNDEKPDNLPGNDISYGPLNTSIPPKRIIFSSLKQVKRFYINVLGETKDTWHRIMTEVYCEAFDTLPELSEIGEFDREVDDPEDHPFFNISQEFFDRFVMDLFFSPCSVTKAYIWLVGHPLAEKIQFCITRTPMPPAIPDVKTHPHYKRARQCESLRRVIPSAVSLLYPVLVEVEEELAAYKARFGDLEGKTKGGGQGLDPRPGVRSNGIVVADGIATEVPGAKRRRVD